MIQGARGRCTGMTQRDGMGREVGGGVQDGEHYCFSSVLDSHPKLRVRRAMDKFILYFRVTELEISGFFLFGKIE